MNGEFAEKLQNAISEKDNDINLYTWKYQNGKDIRLMDMDKSELQRCYDHCYSMLWNKSIYSPGKYQVRINIQNTFNNCNAELLLRYLLHDCDIDIIRTNKDLLDFINSRKKLENVNQNDYVTVLFQNLPPIFEKVTVDKLMMACFDKLDVLNRKMISDKFILSQGIWLTDEEKSDLTEYDSEGLIRNRLDVIKERLILNDVKLRVNRNGLSYNEFRSLVKLEPIPKISSLPTNTLKLLRDKILLLLDNDLEYHIEKWKNLISQIEKVAEYKRIMLICQEA